MLQLGIITGIFITLILLFFYWYLPSATHHNEYITVPKIEGLPLAQIENILEDKGLRYEINDSTFKTDVKPFTVLSQHPLAGSQVKENRRIYITIAAQNPPNLKMPELLDQSVRGAEMTLKSLGLLIGEVRTTPNPSNVVLKQYVKGVEIKAGTSIPKGSKIDLLVGSGRGTTEVDVPNLVGQNLDEAHTSLQTMGLILGLTNYDSQSALPEGTVTKQKPAYQTGVKLRSGDMIDVWVSGTDPAAP
ncbi:MAG: PASTA domain-containing protein [Cytophagales bacterium]|nr:PASTA domain-containing protein [Cytophaga sp.]